MELNVKHTFLVID